MANALPIPLDLDALPAPRETTLACGCVREGRWELLPAVHRLSRGARYSAPIVRPCAAHGTGVLPPIQFTLFEEVR